jgi:hypothetical protein
MTENEIRISPQFWGSAKRYNSLVKRIDSRRDAEGLV